MRWRRWGLTVIVLVSGCYLSHEREEARDDAATLDAGAADAAATLDAAPVDAAECGRDEHCEDGDPCTRDRCIAALCVATPIPFTRVARFPLSEGRVADVATHMGEVLVLTDPAGIERFDAAGPVGSRQSLGPMIGERDWDSGLVSVGTDVAIVTETGTGMLVQRLLSEPAVHDSVPSMGLFVGVAWTGSTLVAFDERLGICQFRFGGGDGRFDGAPPLPGACPYSVGSPPSNKPTGVSGDEARYVSTDPDGHVIALSARPGGVTERSFTLPVSVGRSAHSLVAAEAPGALLGAQWVERRSETERAVRSAVLRTVGEDLVPLGDPVEHNGDGASYSFMMSTSLCSQRFVMVSRTNTTLGALQLGLDGNPLADRLTTDAPMLAGDLTSACVPGGMVVAQSDAVFVLTCEP